MAAKKPKKKKHPELEFEIEVELPLKKKNNPRKKKDKYGPRAEKKIKDVMEEFKEGELKSGRNGKKVKNRKQAIAIGIAEARKRGFKVPKSPAKSRKKKK